MRDERLVKHAVAVQFTLATDGNILQDIPSHLYIYPSKIYNICVIVQDRKKWKRLLLSTLNSAQTNTLISEPSRPLPTDQIVGSSYSHKLDNSNHNYPHYYYPINHPDTGHHHALPPQYTRYSTQTTTTTDNLQVKRRRNQPPGGHVRSPKHT